MLNKTAQSNLKYIAIVIGILMLLPFFNRLVDSGSETYTPRRGKARGGGRRQGGGKKVRRDAPKRWGTKCKFASRRMRKKLGC